MSVRTAGPIGDSVTLFKRTRQEPVKNWCPDCNRRPRDPLVAIFCKNYKFHMQPTSHGEEVKS